MGSIKTFHVGLDSTGVRRTQKIVLPLVPATSGRPSENLDQTLGGTIDIVDLLKKVAYKAFIRLSKFRFESSLGAWLMQIAINEVCQWWRSHSKLHAVSVEELSQGILDLL